MSTQTAATHDKPRNRGSVVMISGDDRSAPLPRFMLMPLAITGIDEKSRLEGHSPYGAQKTRRVQRSRVPAPNNWLQA
jgi:hypothetical protein